MDPTTTLITFMLHTSHSSKSVDLVGSWDNFRRRYPMERDTRRGGGEWRGLHSFKDIICDGKGEKGPERNGGLKMGHDYWYYYELHDGTEIHNTALPSTTSCPYLPGQPVNVLNVPVQISPLRERSASEGAISPGVQTMNPADKFLTPRVPPPTPRPQLARLNTSPALLDRKTSTRSASENGPRSPWSARSLFGLKAAMSAIPGSQDRGRIVPPISRDSREIIIKPVLPSVDPSRVTGPMEGKSLKSILETDAIPGTMSSQEQKLHPIRKGMLRDPSPLRHATTSDAIANPVALTIPDGIAEEELEDDDANFANPTDHERSLTTKLSPPPRRLHNLRTCSSDMKPLPKLPEEQSPAPVAESPSLVPAPLNLTPHNSILPNTLVARSHFSVDTISTELVSPTESHFSSAPSIYDSNDEEDGAPDDSFTFNSASTSASPPSGLANGFQYSLPVGDMGSESTLKRGDVAGLGLSENGKVALRQTFGPGTFESPEGKGPSDTVSALDQLLAEMGFLGGVIVGKEG